MSCGRNLGMTVDEPTLFFIVGRGRSGTTLLSRMLGAHPAMAVAPEGFFVANLERNYSRGPWDEQRIAAFGRDLTKERRMARWGLPWPKLAARLRALGGAPDYGQVCRAVYRCYAEDCLNKVALRAVGDKNPHYALLVPRLARRFPQARFIHMVRDPRDNVLSYRQVPFDVRQTHALAQRWRLYNERILQATAALPQRTLRVRYEDLLRAPEATLAQICTFLSLPYDAAMMRFFEQPLPNFYGEHQAWHARASSPLSADQVGRYRQLLSRAEIAAIERIAGPLLVAFGYEPSAQAVCLRGSVFQRVRERALRGLGTASVRAEELVFATLPASMRMGLINGYRKATGRI